MSTSLLHYAWGIRGYTYVCTRYKLRKHDFQDKTKHFGTTQFVLRE
uniref:Transposase n=1 Tax=Candidatus Kentrum sp. TC TaxID=2126339 RepID=A0A450YY77_9GAMM|nr:MAG: hypothetical protein BECKTC1821D_GA0114238_103121 [Candidatus Kentron sp. TC]